MAQNVQLSTVEQLALKDSALAKMLREHPEYSSYALGTLCFVAAGAFEIDGSPLSLKGPMPMAFWWANGTGPRQTGMRGTSNWVQLGSWYSSAAPDRSRILATDPMAEFVDIRMERQAGVWRLSLELADALVRAEVHVVLEGSVHRAPGQMSVILSGAGSGYYTVYTYHGHVVRPAQGSWQASGRGVLGRLVELERESPAFRTEFQHEWSARSGLYRTDQ